MNCEKKGSYIACRLKMQASLAGHLQQFCLFLTDLCMARHTRELQSTRAVLYYLLLTEQRLEVALRAMQKGHFVQTEVETSCVPTALPRFFPSPLLDQTTTSPLQGHRVGMICSHFLPLQ